MSWNFSYNIVGSKAKGRISKWLLQENKARRIFRKNKEGKKY